jgi:hypothetical protein
MKYDINQPIFGLTGEPLVGLFGKGDDKVITYASLFTLVSGNGQPDDKAEDKYISFKMAVQFANTLTGALVDISDSGSVRLKKLVGTNYTPTIYGRVVEFLNSPVVEALSPAAPTALLDHLAAE